MSNRLSKYIFSILISGIFFVFTKTVDKRSRHGCGSITNCGRKWGELDSVFYVYHIVLRQFKYWISKFKSETGSYSRVVHDGSSIGHFIQIVPLEVQSCTSVKLAYPNGVELTGGWF
ncbi:MAG: hypothetical protein ACK5JS_05300 [Mangrovibacterium sp.]